MIIHLFDNGLQEEDYKVISGDDITRRPNNCPAPAPMECNPQILGALKTDAWRADSLLREVSADIIKAHWVKFLLDRSGLDIVKFKAGSVRPAAASNDKAMSVPIKVSPHFYGLIQTGPC